MTASNDARLRASRAPFVVFGDDWGRNVSTMQHLFRIIAGRHPVIWVNGIGHRLPTFRWADFRRAAQKLLAMLRSRDSSEAGHVDVGVRPQRVVHPRVLPWHQYRLVRAYNTRSLLRTIRRVLAEEGLDEAPILVTGSPPSAPLVGRLGERVSMYLCMDDFLHLPNVSPEMLGPLERELLGKVDVVVATAAALVDLKRPKSGRSHYLPQGVQFEHFATERPMPSELVALPRPLIGFAGGVTTPMDFDLVRRVAQANRSGSVVLVGPVGADGTELAGDNIHVLGRRPYAELPAYVQAFDVGIIPYVLNEHTVAVDPLKLLEYLAAGVPVVTTDLPEVRKYRDAVAIAGTHDEFLRAVGRACGPAAAIDVAADRAARRAFARENGWERRADRLLGILGELIVGAGAAELPERR